MRKLTLSVCLGIAACVLVLSTLVQEGAWSQSIRFKIVTANPSSVKPQKVPVKVYLPEEVAPGDVLDLGGLNLEFDSEKSLYYVYKDDLMLEAKQIRAFDVELRDIWRIESEEIEGVTKRIEVLLNVTEGTQYYAQVKNLSQQLEMLGVAIERDQNDENLSRSQHIGVYRTNKKELSSLRDRVSEIERILNPPQGPLTPEQLAKMKFKTESPTKTATWIAIFVIMFFMALISIVIFITWYRQGKATAKVLAEAKKATFNDYGEKKT